MTETSTLKVLVFDWQPRQESLSERLSQFDAIAATASCDKGERALAKVAETGADLVVIAMDGESEADEGIALTRLIKESSKKTRLLAITACQSADEIFTALDSGADGYLLAENVDRDLETAVRSIRLGPVWLDPAIARYVMESAKHAQTRSGTRELPTGILPMPLSIDEFTQLHDVAESRCQDGVCYVDPGFLAKLKRFAS